MNKRNTKLKEQEVIEPLGDIKIAESRGKWTVIVTDVFRFPGANPPRNIRDHHEDQIAHGRCGEPAAHLGGETSERT